MENTPEAVVYTDREQGATIKQQVGGGDVDVEQQDYATQPHVTVTTQQVSGARQTVRPSPTHANVQTTKTQTQQQSSGGGWLSGLATRTRGRYFFPLHAAIAFFSFMVFVSAALIEDRTTTPLGNRFAQYEMMIAELAFALSLGACVMERVGLVENPHVRVALSAFQVFFWAPALVIMTFYGSFVSPIISANGFFGAWGALLASAVIFSHETDRARTNHNGNTRRSSAPRTSLVLLFFSSLMVMGSGIRVYYNRGSTSGVGGTTPGGTTNGIPGTTSPYALNNGPFGNPQFGNGEFDTSYNYSVFAIAFGAITAFFSGLFLIFLDAMPGPTLIALGTVFWVWVAVGMLLLTFVDPYVQAFSNGYYSVLFCLLSSFGLLVSIRHAERRDDRTARNTEEDRESMASAGFFLFMRGLAFASLVVLIASVLVCRDTPGGGCDNGGWIWQVCVGAISLGLCLLVILLEAFGLYRVHAFVKMAIALFLWAWWVAGFIFLTFYGTFQSPVLSTAWYANGFFFSWVGLIFASLAFAEALKDRARTTDPPSPLTAKTGFLLLVIVGSAIELGAAIKWYYDTNYSGLSRYAIALGCVSIGWVILMFLVLICVRSKYEAHDALYNGGLYLLTLWWAVGSLIVTFMGLWTAAVDNGYFSVFFTLGTCLLALSGVWRTDDDEEDEYDERRNTTNQQSQQQQQTYIATTTTSAARY